MLKIHNLSLLLAFTGVVLAFGSLSDQKLSTGIKAVGGLPACNHSDSRLVDCPTTPNPEGRTCGQEELVRAHTSPQEYLDVYVEREWVCEANYCATFQYEVFKGNAPQGCNATTL